MFGGELKGMPESNSRKLRISSAIKTFNYAFLLPDGDTNLK